MEWNPELAVIGRIALAMLLGGLIGIERETANRPAGFRTHTLVCATAAMLVGLTDPLLDLGRLHAGSRLTFDPLRIVEAVVTGVSFLGAGTIFRRSGTSHVEGLTTAASLLACAAVGIAVGTRQYVLAISVTVLILLVLRSLLLVENRARSKASTPPSPGEDLRPRAPPPNDAPGP
jgi:putative Mg2+ transporter-C (MgtC) family protein